MQSLLEAISSVPVERGFSNMHRPNGKLSLFLLMGLYQLVLLELHTFIQREIE